MEDRRNGMDWDDEEALETQVIEMTMDNALLLQALITKLVEKGIVTEEEIQAASEDLLKAVDPGEILEFGESDDV